MIIGCSSLARWILSSGQCYNRLMRLRRKKHSETNLRHVNCPTTTNHVETSPQSSSVNSGKVWLALRQPLIASEKCSYYSSRACDVMTVRIPNGTDPWDRSNSNPHCQSLQVYTRMKFMAGTVAYSYEYIFLITRRQKPPSILVHDL